MIEILIENGQDKAEFTPQMEKTVQDAVAAVLRVLKCDGIDCEVSVTITDDGGIREINREYRQKDTPTDVLSFPMLSFDENGVMIEESADYDGDLLLLGDIVISLERVVEQAEEYGHGVLREIGFLTVHAMLHLMGFDHMEEPYASMMREKEEETLALLGLER